MASAIIPLFFAIGLGKKTTSIFQILVESKMIKD